MANFKPIKKIKEEDIIEEIQTFLGLEKKDFVKLCLTKIKEIIAREILKGNIIILGEIGKIFVSGNKIEFETDRSFKQLIKKYFRKI